SRRVELMAKVTTLASELDYRRDLLRELAELEDNEQKVARKVRLAAAQAAFDEASLHSEALGKAAGAEKSRRIEMERAQERLAALRDALAELKAANGLLESANAAAAQTAERHRDVDAALTDERIRYENATSSAQNASDALRSALRRQAATSAH